MSASHSVAAPFDIRRLSSRDAAPMRAMIAMFAEAFEDRPTYTEAPPGDRYLAGLLADPTFVALAALSHDAVVGGLAAYELRKFERERSEIYIYDLAVAASHRRQGIATALIAASVRLAAARGAHVVFVQADPADAPAVALYSRLGVREDVLHFDIAVR